MPNASEMANSNEILSLYKHDERAALQKLFDIYYEPLLLYCYRLIRDSESAEDIVQDCFVHIWRSQRLENFEGTGSIHVSGNKVQGDQLCSRLMSKRSVS